MIFLTKPYFDKEELEAVKDTLNSGWVAGQGPKSSELSNYIKSYIGCNFTIPVNNCTAGLHLSLLSIGIKPYDEVLVSDFTFPATGHAVMYCNAKPRFVDVDLQTFNIDPSKIIEKITNKTKAIIVVHAFGQMADMERILEIAAKYKLKVIEDAACSLGATYKGIPAGRFGDIAAFSFHARKGVTSGEGGIVVTNNEQYANTISSLSCFGMESALNREKTFSIPSFNLLGYNYKLSDINSSIVLEQIKRYPLILKKKKELISLYNELLKDNKFIIIPKVGKNNYHVYQTYAIILHETINRDKLIISLKNDDIQTQIATYSSHIQPVYKSDDICPNSLFLFNQSLALPLYYDLTEDEIRFVVDRLEYHISKQIN